MMRCKSFSSSQSSVDSVSPVLDDQVLLVAECIRQSESASAFVGQAFVVHLASQFVNTVEADEMPHPTSCKIASTKFVLANATVENGVCSCFESFNSNCLVAFIWEIEWWHLLDGRGKWSDDAHINDWQVLGQYRCDSGSSSGSGSQSANKV